MKRIIFIIFYFTGIWSIYGQNNKFYFAQDSAILSFNIDSNKSYIEYKIPKIFKPQSISDIKYNNGTFVWPIENKKKLIVYKNELIKTANSNDSEICIIDLPINYTSDYPSIYGSNVNPDTIPKSINYFDDFFISPDGNSIIWSSDCNLTYTLDSCKKKFQIYKYDLSKQKTEKIFEEKYKFGGLGYSNFEYRKLIHYSDSGYIYFNTLQQGQLNSKEINLVKYNINNKKKSFVSSKIEKVLLIDDLNKKIIYTNDDQSCCGGLNYTNNLIFDYNYITNKTTEIFNEQETYKNHKSYMPVPIDETIKDYIPEKVNISENNDVVGFSLLGIKDDNHFVWLTTIKSLSGKIKTTGFENKIIINWIHESDVLLGSLPDNNYNFKINEHVFIFNLKEKKLRELPLKNVFILGTCKF
ncbi:MAG TPA: hypothetical protein PKK00_11000 [Bacteroidales bacterium]|nr:hypothetical protein [Bacteroidales bacterium]HPS17628.1 hypothetical protein [Bacteroidales bacterium]